MRNEAKVPPLPRSLDPVAGESLVSYLLRLGHRLGLSPLHLMRATRATGWTSHTVPFSLLLDLPTPQAQAFAQLTKQTAEEVSALTLTQWRDRYPPISRSMTHPIRTMPDEWLYFGSPRFCPGCLAGDGSPAQRLHGGPWRKIWHLPIVFACVEHQTYLEGECPHCGQPHERPGLLLQRVNDHTLHPAQCRWTVGTQTQKRKSYACAGRLDDSSAFAHIGRPKPDAEILRFQQSLLSRLAPSTSAKDAYKYFTDLRLVAALISATWPHGRKLFDAETARKIRSYSQSLQGGEGGKRYHQWFRDTPPRDSATCGALLMAADQMLSRRDLPDLLSDFTRAANSASNQPRSRTSWVVVYDRHKSDCSEQLRQAADPVTRVFLRKGTHLQTGYQPEHIPAFLEPDWHQRHLASYAGSRSKTARRIAAIRLVQQVMGGSDQAAAEFLEIPPIQRYVLRGRDTRWPLSSGCSPIDFDRALRALTSELQSPCKPPIDYRRRRQALHEWVISPDTWNALIRHLPRSPHVTQIDFGDRKRQTASVYVWTLITQGEHLFAPRPLEAAQPPEVRQQWARRRNTTWFQFTRPNPMSHYAEMRRILSEYAQQLARDIDSGVETTD
ncbi:MULTISPECIES: TniQ family protein [unclassified Streptomyces]|uniref:TniQ family protein n=1 Tax=unclassified Streptomyces TaxID=2593676 RepID=UPI001EDB00AE|nr:MULTISPECIES: TniQ family protein [unclassified Streptomyces]UKL04872.1 TniQ family protein [Streptomyces sp. NBU3104]